MNTFGQRMLAVVGRCERSEHVRTHFSLDCARKRLKDGQTWSQFFNKIYAILGCFGVAGPLGARAAHSKRGAFPRPPLNPPGVVSPDLKALGTLKSDHPKT